MIEKERIYQEIEERKADFSALSDQIWDLAETSMREYRSAAAHADFLRREGFEVEEGVAGVPTAFTARYGSGRPVIGILGEYDALSTLSQKASITHREPEQAGGSGHGCGHNLLGTGSVAAAVAVKTLIADGALPGTIVFYGCPGEEACAGKTFMARAGMFRDLDAALCWHPGDTNEVRVGSNAATLQYVYTFRGVSAHAADNPEMGRSALDALELMNVGVQFLREHMPRTASVHYAVLDTGGISPNVVQSSASAVYMLRAETVAEDKKLLARVHKIAQGAAMMTETEVSWRQIDGTSSVCSNRVLEEALYRSLCAAPLPAYTEEEERFAQALFETYEKTGLPGGLTALCEEIRDVVAEKSQNGTAALNNFVVPYQRLRCLIPSSTDVGDVSWLTPTAQITTACWTSGSPGHSWQNVSIGKSSIAHKGMLLAAKVLAATAVDLMEQPELLARAREAFRKDAAAGYDCPLEADTKPIPVE